jgi:hypothetical protein
MHLWMNKFKDIQTNEKNVKTAIISANNHYAGFGPMTAKLFAEMMMDLKNNVNPFPILDYKITSSNETSLFENNNNYRSYKKQHYFKRTRQTDISEFFNK